MLAGCVAPSDKNSTTQASGQVVILSSPGFVEGWNLRLRMSSGDTVKAIFVTPDTVDDTIHVITEQNYDHVIRRNTGDFLFFNQIGGPDARLMGSPLLIPGHLVYTTDHTLEVYKRNGHFERTVDLKSWVSSPAIASHGLIFLGLAKVGGEVAGIDLNLIYNPVAWEVLTRGTVNGAPAAQGSLIFAGSDQGGVLALEDDHTGAWTTLPRSTFMTNGKILGDIKADATNVYVSSTDGQLYCLNGNTGTIKWRYFADAGLEQGPDVTATTVYQLVPHTGLAAIDRELKQPLEGSESKFLAENPIHPARWIAPDAVRFLSEDKKYTYVLSHSNTVMALDKQTGQKKFESHRSGLTVFATNNSPKDATIYASSRDGRVIAIRPMTTPGGTGELVLIERPIGPVALAPQPTN
jgi:outer membrane protein assembly factor BamB